MSEPLDLPGYDVEAMLGFGATGEVWRARESATGDLVALKRLRPGADPAALEALRREATLLRTLDTPYVVRLRAVVGDVLVLDHAPGGSLAALLTRRGVLDPGEVVTIAVPLASALAVAHGLGLVHGDVSPANVLFTSDGMPLLADLGVARVAGEQLATVDGTVDYLDPAVAAGGEPDAAADVWALAALCHHLLAGSPPHDGASTAEVLAAAVEGTRAPLGLLAPSAPRALVAAVEAGLVADPADRPDAAAFCSLLRRAHAAAPVRLMGGSPAYAPARETQVVRSAAAPAHAARGRWARSPGRLSELLPGWLLARVSGRVLPALALVGLVLLAAGVGWVSGRGELPGAAAVTSPVLPAAAAAARPSVAPTTVPAARPPVVRVPAARSPGARPPGSASDWGAVLDGLDAARSRAFEQADPAGLQAVWAPGSPGSSADAVRLRRLRADGQRAVGLRHGLRDVRVTAAAATSARLAVVDVLSEHEVRSGSGEVVRRVAERGSTSWVVTLTRTAAGWRLVSVTRA